MKDWFYDESTHVGADYARTDKAAVYDEEMETYRDYDAEARAFIEKSGLKNTEQLTALDLGCGTGAFALHAAGYFKQMIAVDISPAMLGVARAKAEERGIANIAFHQGGLLRFQPDAPVDVVHTKWALHHLPDFWQQNALVNINRMLKSGGTLFLSDFVFRFDPNYETTIQAMIDRLGEQFDDAFMDEVREHIRDEYSTYDWIIEGMLKRAGFQVENTTWQEEIETEFLCTKVASFD